MREIEIGGQRLFITASPLTAMLYEQEFSYRDKDGNVLNASLFRDLESCSESMDRFVLLKATWAMAKTIRWRSPFPSFMEWADTLRDIDFSDPAPFNPIVEEINQGFFRSAANRDNGGGEGGHDSKAGSDS